MWDHPLKPGKPSMVVPPCPANTSMQKFLSKRWDLKASSSIYAGIRAGLLMCRWAQLLWVHGCGDHVVFRRQRFTELILQPWHSSPPLLPSSLCLGCGQLTQVWHLGLSFYSLSTLWPVTDLHTNGCPPKKSSVSDQGWDQPKHMDIFRRQFDGTTIKTFAF